MELTMQVPAGDRDRELRIAHDGYIAGKSLREIAEHLYGPA